MAVAVVTVPPADALLADGSVVEIRVITADDYAGLEQLYDRTSKESLRLRFFSYSDRLGHLDIERMTRPPEREHIALAAVHRSTIVGVASLNRSGAADRAEFALLVDESRHGQGIGTLLLEHVFALARRLGYRQLHADVLTENQEMLKVIRGLGAHPEMHSSFGVVDVDFVLPRHGDWELAVHERDGVAEHASLSRVLAPGSVAVVGVGRRPTSVGRRILGNLVASGYAGRLYAVNPTAQGVGEIRAFRSLRDLPEPPDLVVVAVPAFAVRDVVQDAAAIGAYGLVIVSDGFAELGGDGVVLQREILAMARASGMRIVGPNCLGIANLDPRVRMNATFADVSWPQGSVGVATQSGGVGLALLDAFARRGIGVSTFVSMGNKADVSGNDMLQYWSRDPLTTACLLYMESFGNARKFAQIARRVARTKPIVAITAGRSVAGARGVKSHTAAATTPDVAIDALFHQAGVIRAASLTEALDVLSLLGAAPVPAGHRVGIVSNGGGPAALAADSCSAVGLDLPVLGEVLQEQLAQVLPAHAARANPIDTTAGGGPAELAECAALLAGSGEVDAVIVIHAALGGSDREAVAAALAARTASCPVLTVFLGCDALPAAVTDDHGRQVLPAFAYPEEAARALAKVTAYGEWLSVATEPPRPPRTQGGKVRSLIREQLRRQPSGGWMDTAAGAQLLNAAHIPVVETVAVDSASEAVATAARLGYPVVIKAGRGEILHRTEHNGVFVNVRSPRAVRHAVRVILDQWGADCPIVIQPMAAAGVETAIGMVQDPSVGPVVMVALGGVATDLLADRSFRLPPLSSLEAHAQIAALRGAPLLSGYRGAEPCDVDALADLLRRVGNLALDHPEITEIDLNPVIVSPGGATVVDVKLKITPADAIDPYLRSLKQRVRASSPPA